MAGPNLRTLASLLTDERVGYETALIGKSGISPPADGFTFFNVLGDDDFQAARGSFLPTAWHRCAGCSLADGGHLQDKGLRRRRPRRRLRHRLRARARARPRRGRRC